MLECLKKEGRRCELATARTMKGRKDGGRGCCLWQLQTLVRMPGPVAEEEGRGVAAGVSSEAGRKEGGRKRK